jgi:adenylate kinase
LIDRERDMIVVFIGAPGSGKGTHAKRLASALGLPHVSTGDLLREAVESRSELGRKAETYMKAGTLVPDDVMLDWVESLLEMPDYRSGVVLDGFPRTIRQAEGLDEYLARRGLKVGCVMQMDISEDDAVERLGARVWCPKCGAVHNLVTNPPRVPGVCDECGGKLETRPDDREETVRQRFREFDALTVPVIRYYEAHSGVVVVGTKGPVDEVEQEVARAFHEHCGA